MNDWDAIRKEYITTNISQRGLAKKYGVSPQSVALRSKQERWVELRKQSLSKANAKMVEKAATTRAKREEKFYEAVDILLEKATKAAQQLEVDGTIDTDKLRKVSASLKDIRDMKGMKSDIDIREQEARIRNLEKQAEADAPKEPMRIILEGADDICL